MKLYAQATPFVYLVHPKSTFFEKLLQNMVLEKAQGVVWAIEHIILLLEMFIELKVTNF